jgi:hypothetical protein
VEYLLNKVGKVGTGFASVAKFEQAVGTIIANCKDYNRDLQTPKETEFVELSNQLLGCCQLACKEASDSLGTAGEQAGRRTRRR